jgi:hypothetical protein
MDEQMIHRILLGTCLIAITTVMHAGGSTAIYQFALRSGVRPSSKFWPVTWLVVRVAWMLIVLHLLEIAVWALFYHYQGCMPDWESAFYFSGVTYSTLGYGDVVLPQEWRLLGPVEGLTGILMCGLSTGFFFAIVSRLRSPGSE